MRYRAIVSFSGKISMAKGQNREISDSALVDDLLNAGYIIPLETEIKPKEEKGQVEDVKEEKPKPKPKRKGKANEN